MRPLVSIVGAEGPKFIRSEGPKKNITMKNRIITKLILLIFFIACSSAPFSSAEVLKLKNGREIEGKIVEETKDRVVLDIGGGEVAFYKKNIKAIIRTSVVDTRKKRKAELEAKADRINAFYYSILDDNVESVEFVFRASTDKAVYDGIKNEDFSDAADRLDNMTLVASYDTGYDRMYMSVNDRPYLENKKHMDSLDKMAAVDRGLLDSFWRVYKPYITRLIDTKRDTVKSVTMEKGNIIVETFSETRVEKKFTFNEKNELQSMEGLDGLNKSKIKETAKFEQYEAKYLANSVQSETQKTEPPKPATPPDPEKEKERKKKLAKEGKKPEEELPKPVIDKLDIEYQIVEGVKWPKTVKYSFQSADPALSLPGSGSIDFVDVKIKFKRD